MPNLNINVTVYESNQSQVGPHSPVAGVTMQLCDSTSAWIASGTTDANGQVSFSGAYNGPDTGVQAPPNVTPYNFNVSVFDGNNAPVPGVDLQILDAAGGYLTMGQTDAAGQFHIGYYMAPGVDLTGYYAIAWKTGWQEQVGAQFQVVDPQTANLTLYLWQV